MQNSCPTHLSPSFLHTLATSYPIQVKLLSLQAALPTGPTLATRGFEIATAQAIAQAGLEGEAFFTTARVVLPSYWRKLPIRDIAETKIYPLVGNLLRTRQRFSFLHEFRYLSTATAYGSFHYKLAFPEDYLEAILFQLPLQNRS